MRRTIASTFVCAALTVSAAAAQSPATRPGETRRPGPPRPAPAARAAPIGAEFPVLQKVPAQTAADAEALAAELVQLGPDGVARLCALLVEPGKGDDSRARMAIHGLAVHVTRPDAADERKMVAGALAAALKADAPAVIKAFLIAQLQIAGADGDVGTLAPFLADRELCDPAVRALLSIGGRAATTALRQALANAEGPNRVTIIQALGDLRDAQAVEALLNDAAVGEPAVRLAAIRALGDIGDPAAGQALADAAAKGEPYEWSLAINAYLTLAERLAETGPPASVAQAAAICRDLLKTCTSDEQRYVQCAALAVLTRAVGADALADLLAAMRSPDRAVRAVATDLAVAVPGEKVTQVWLAQLAQADTPAAKVQILNVLARRGDKSALAACQAELAHPDRQVRAAAVPAVAALGSQDALGQLLTLAASSQPDDRRAAQQAVILMPGEAITTVVAASLADERASVREAALIVLGSRGAAAHSQAIMDATRDPNEAVRLAAITAAGAVAGEPAYPALIDLLTGAPTDRQRDAAEKALLAVCDRVRDRALWGTSVAEAMAKAADAKSKIALIHVLGKLAGEKNLAAVQSALKDSAPEVCEAATRALSDWPDASAVPALQALLESQPPPPTTSRILALRGYIRLATADKKLAPDQRARMLGWAMEYSFRPEEIKLVLSKLPDVPSVATMRLAEAFLNDQRCQAEAALAAARVAAAVRRTAPADAQAVLEKVLLVAKDEGTVRSARDGLAQIEKETGLKSQPSTKRE